ncbi:hypothetical protein GCM10009608_71310 [Pseudonocardia alaniniphila]
MLLKLITAGRRVSQVAADLDISDQTTCTPRRPELVDIGELPGRTSADNAELVTTAACGADLFDVGRAAPLSDLGKGRSPTWCCCTDPASTTLTAMRASSSSGSFSPVA